ncbi:MAG: hypothetical protein SGJ27_11010 [Candidatus Melainabacteria bacterium]|nr:hypothetical protein [Candidatus Melainabacteria bacterium]
MNSFIEIVVYGKQNIDEDARNAIELECKKYWVLPGAEKLSVSFDIDDRTKSFLSNHAGFTPVAYGSCETCWSLNPALSKCSASYVARALATRLGPDFHVVLSINSAETECSHLPGWQLSFLELISVFLTPIYMLSRLRVIVSAPFCFILSLIDADWQRLYQQDLKNRFKELGFVPAARLPEQFSWAVKTNPPYLLNKEASKDCAHATDVHYKQSADFRQWLYRHSFGCCDLRSTPCFTLIESDQLLKLVPDFTVLVTERNALKASQLVGFRRGDTGGLNFFDKKAIYIKCDDDSFLNQHILALSNAPAMTIEKSGKAVVFGLVPSLVEKFGDPLQD